MLSILFFLACDQGTDKALGEFPVVELSRPSRFVELCNREATLLQEILKEDMKGMKTPLELIHFYSEILNKGKSHGKTGKKPDALFLCGRSPCDMNGFYHGIITSLKTGFDICAVVEDAPRRWS